jgi:hypothetical protein
MNRSYINEVKFRHEKIELRKPKKEKQQRELRESVVRKHAPKAVFTTTITVAILIVLNIFICTVVNGCRDTHYKTVIGCWQDFQEYVEHNR